MQQADGVALLALYERGQYDAFDNSVRAFGAAPINVRTFTRAAERWIRADARSERRRTLIAAAVTAELAAVLTTRDLAPDLLDRGRRWLRAGYQRDIARQWYRAALGAALVQGHAELLLASQDVQPMLDRVNPKYRGYVHDALREFPDDSTALLFKAIAFELTSAPAGPAQWLDRDAIERHVRAMTRRPDGRQPPSLPTTVRMDVASAERLFKPDVADLGNVQYVAEISLRLWRVVAMFRELQRDPAMASEATLRLGVTYSRLARPDMAASEFERALRAPATPFVTYLVHFFRGQQFEMADRPEDAEIAYWLALRAVPDAQSASFELAPLLFASGRRSEVERLVAAAVRAPLTPDPIKTYGAGDPKHLRDALAGMRQELQ